MVAFVFVFRLLVIASVYLGFCVCYERPRARPNLSLSLSVDPNQSLPQQVHISMVGKDSMRISWITEDEMPPTVEYGKSKGIYNFSVTGNTTSYRYLLYKSGHIHEAVVGPLDPDTVYYYQLSSDSRQEYSLKTTPANFPIKFVVIGDLGQTGWTETTLQHINKSEYDMLLLPGDLSYADFDQPLWDSFGLLVEPLASKRPWMVTQGNHEIERIPLMTLPFVAYNARWKMPFIESGSTSNLYYSFDVVGAHIIMLGSYTDYDVGSDQYKWLESDLQKVDRNVTPWLIILFHAPWYNSNKAHQGEGENMRVSMEELIYRARADIVFVGHVHAYERFTRVYNGQKDDCAPVHITIGDGGNREGLASEYLDPRPDISLFREASFGHGQLELVNATHALWTWNRNDDDVMVTADSIWLANLASHAICQN